MLNSPPPGPSLVPAKVASVIRSKIAMKYHIRCLLFVIFVALAQLGRAADNLPIVFQEDFEHGADRWEPKDPAQWQIKKTEQGQVYSQFKKETTYKPPHRSPTNVAIEKSVAFS